MWAQLLEWIEDLEDLVCAAPRIHLAHWWGWARYSEAQLRDLKAAGVTELIFNVNDAGGRGRWEWDGSRAKILERMVAAAELGFDVSLMPWVWAGRRFMDRCGKECAALIADFGGPVRQIQLDWEGSAEVSARGLARKAGGDYDRAVDPGLRALCAHLPPAVAVGITTLYFRRKGGDAASRWSWTTAGHTWRISEQVCQAYAIWDTKNAATLEAKYQPPRLQERCAELHAPMRGLFARWGMGVAGWKLKRPKMTAAEAMAAQVEGCLGAGVEVFNVWGGHLMDEARKKVEAERFGLALDAYRRVGGAETPALKPSGPRERVLWGEAYRDEGLADGGAPKGYSLPRRAGRRGEVAGLRDDVRAVLRWALLQKPPRGWVVPIDLGPRGRAAVVVQRHPWTHRGGKRVHGDFTGATLFFEV